MKNLKNINFKNLFLTLITVYTNSSCTDGKAGQQLTAAEIFKQSQEMARQHRSRAIEEYVSAAEKKVDAKLNENRRALIEAIIEGDLETINFLFYNRKIDPELIDQTTGKSALQIAEDELRKHDTAYRKLIVDRIKKEISEKNLKLGTKIQGFEEFENVKRSEERPFLTLLVKDLNVYVQRFIEKKIQEQDLNNALQDFKYNVFEYIEDYNPTDKDFKEAIKIAKEYASEYQKQAQKNMSYTQWATSYLYADPVTSFWTNVIKTLQSRIE